MTSSPLVPTSLTASDTAWGFTSRFGEAQILLPALAALLLWWALRPDSRRVAALWLGCLATAIAVTTLSKLAFIGWGVGWARLDFTGISGHSMFAATVMPMLVAGATAGRPPAVRHTGLAIAFGLAALIAVSRLMVQVHSVSEVIAGFATGVLATGVALRVAPAPVLRPPLALIAGVMVVLATLLAKTPTAPTHGLVIRMALAMSGRSEPYTREMLLQRLQPLPDVNGGGGRRVVFDVTKGR